MKQSLNRGFTFAEMFIILLVVTGIMSTVLYSYSTFNDKLALSSAAQEIAITIRQAQSYGLTVKEASVSGGNFNYGYGVFVDIATDPTHYYLFVDKDADEKYDAGTGCKTSNTECVEQGIIRNGVVVSNICDATNCPPVVNVKRMNVVFVRPNPDAKIYFNDVLDNVLSGPSATGKITLSSPKGNSINVIIESTGQISIQ